MPVLASVTVGACTVVVPDPSDPSSVAVVGKGATVVGTYDDGSTKTLVDGESWCRHLPAASVAMAKAHAKADVGA